MTYPKNFLGTFQNNGGGQKTKNQKYNIGSEMGLNFSSQLLLSAENGPCTCRQSHRDFSGLTGLAAWSPSTPGRLRPEGPDLGFRGFLIRRGALRATYTSRFLELGDKQGT